MTSTRTVKQTEHAADRLHRIIDRSLFLTSGRLTYSRVLEAIRLLARILHEGETDESTWYIGEFRSADLASLIVGAYWFCADYHAGQGSAEYATLSALGTIYPVESTGMVSGPEPDSCEIDVYSALVAKMKE